MFVSGKFVCTYLVGMFARQKRYDEETGGSGDTSQLTAGLDEVERRVDDDNDEKGNSEQPATSRWHISWQARLYELANIMMIVSSSRTHEFASPEITDLVDAVILRSF